MNEFIVFDKKSKKFDEDTEYIIDKNGELFFIEYEDTGSWLDGVVFILAADENKDVFFYIGKTDINGKKIYADCSIVELRIALDVENSFEIIIGYFRYNEIELCYEFIEPLFDNFSRRKLNYSIINFRVFDLKIIGTMQENPELLE